MPATGLATRVVTLGSRGSQLALWQAQFVASRLNALGVTTRVEVIKTTGDHLQTAFLVQAGGKGLFTKEIEEALLSGTIDVAVHSLKDLPTQMRPGLAIAAVPEREDPRDVMVGSPISALPLRARVGTSSGRRAAQLRNLRPDLRIEPIRGNLDTRIRKLKDGQYEAIVLAGAGLRRLGLAHEIAEVLSPDQMCPAAGQGALAVQTRACDPAFETCARLNHKPTSQAVDCERTALAALGGGCQLPIGVLADPIQENMRVMAVVASPDGRQLLRGEAIGRCDHPEELGQAVATDLLSRGAGEILSQVK